MTEDEMVRWHHQLNGHEFEQAPGAGDGQGSLACCRPWGSKDSDTTTRKMVPKNLFTEQQWKHRHGEQTYGQGWGDKWREWPGCIYIHVYK